MQTYTRCNYYRGYYTVSQNEAWLSLGIRMIHMDLTLHIKDYILIFREMIDVTSGVIYYISGEPTGHKEQECIRVAMLTVIKIFGHFLFHVVRTNPRLMTYNSFNAP